VTLSPVRAIEGKKTGLRTRFLTRCAKEKGNGRTKAGVTGVGVVEVVGESGYFSQQQKTEL